MLTIIIIVSYLGVLATLIYGFIILLITISETHRIGLPRAFSSVILGLMLLATTLFTFLKVLSLMNKSFSI